MKKKINKSVENKKAGNGHSFPIILVLLILLVLSLIFWKISSGETQKVNLYFKPSKIVLKSAGLLEKSSEARIMVSVGMRKLAFARVSLTFDPSVVSLSSEIVTQPQLSTVVQKADIIEANRSGRLVFVIASSPEDDPPSGTFELAAFHFRPASENSRVSRSKINFVISDMQLVDKNVEELSLNTRELEIELR